MQRATILCVLLLLGLVTCSARALAKEPALPSITSLPTRTLRLPAIAKDMVVGGAGKYLIADLESLQQLAIIDVKQAKVVKYLPVPSPEILFAAGAEKLFVIRTDKNTIHRYSLTTFQQEASAPLPHGLSPGTLTLGHASTGPLLLGPSTDQAGGWLVNPQTLRVTWVPLPRMTGNTPDFACNADYIVRAAAQGQLFTSCRERGSPTEFHALHAQGDKITPYYNFDSCGMLLPSADGERIYTQRGVFSNTTKPIVLDRAQTGEMLPSVTGDFYVNTDRGDPRTYNHSPQSHISLYLAGNAQPFAKLGGVPFLEPEADRGKLQCTDKRLFYFPDLSALAILALTDNKIDFVTIDLEAELKKSNLDYLLFRSQPPQAVVAGQSLAYQTAVISNKPAVKVSLAAGPAGMQIDDQGKLTWQASTEESGDVDVILSATNADGQEAFQTFRIRMVPPSNTKPASAPPVKSPPPTGPATPRPAPKSTTSTILYPAKFEGRSVTIKLPAVADMVEFGGAGRYAVAHLKAVRKLAVVDLCEAKITGYIPVIDDNVQFAAGLDKLVVVLGKKRTLSRWNLQSLQLEATAPLTVPVARVAMGSASHGPVLLTPESGDVVQAFWDLSKLQPLKVVTNPNWQNAFSEREYQNARVSADGRTFTIGAVVFLFTGQKILAQNTPSHQGETGMLPNADGQILYADGYRFTQQSRPIGPYQEQEGFSDLIALVPATQGHFFMAIRHQSKTTQRGAPGKQKVDIWLDDSLQRIARLEHIRLTAPLEDSLFDINKSIPLDKRIAFVPSAHLLAMLAPTHDELTLRRINLSTRLTEQNIDCLYVTSHPPASIKPGEMMHYQVAAESQRGDIKYRLDAGPEGMSLSDDGLLTWQAPTDSPAAVHSIIVSISDAATQEVAHTFPLLVDGA